MYYSKVKWNLWNTFTCWHFPFIIWIVRSNGDTNFPLYTTLEQNNVTITFWVILSEASLYTTFMCMFSFCAIVWDMWWLFRLRRIKLCSDRTKADAKAKIFFDVCRLFLDLFCFRSHFRLVWVGPRTCINLTLQRDHFEPCPSSMFFHSFQKNRKNTQKYFHYRLYYFIRYIYLYAFIVSG